MPLYVLNTMVQNSQKWPKTQIKGGPALTCCSIVYKESHLMWNMHKTKKERPNVPQKMLACIGFLNKVIQQSDHLWKPKLASSQEFNLSL